MYNITFKRIEEIIYILYHLKFCIISNFFKKMCKYARYFIYNILYIIWYTYYLYYIINYKY